MTARLTMCAAAALFASALAWQYNGPLALEMGVSAMPEFWIVVGAVAAVGALYLRRVIRRWEAEDEFYDRWEFGGWADEVSDSAP